MSSKPKKRVHPAVKTAVLAWANEPELDRAAAVLAKARRAIDPALAAELTQEIAEITAETLLELLNRSDGFVPGEPIEVFGVSLLPKQAERFAAWLQDQRATAEALAFELEQWKRAIEAALRRMAGTSPAAIPGTAGADVVAVADEQRRKNAQKLLGLAPAARNACAPAVTAAATSRKRGL